MDVGWLTDALAVDNCDWARSDFAPKVRDNSPLAEARHRGSSLRHRGSSLRRRGSFHHHRAHARPSRVGQVHFLWPKQKTKIQTGRYKLNFSLFFSDVVRFLTATYSFDGLELTRATRIESVSSNEVPEIERSIDCQRNKSLLKIVKIFVA
jgi:hypothetical protein